MPKKSTPHATNKKSPIISSIHVIAYDQQRFIKQDINDLAMVQTILGQWPVLWVQIIGVPNHEQLNQLAAIFNLHPLALEDVMHVRQRPKIDDYGTYQFIVTRVPKIKGELVMEQVALFLGKNFIITFQLNEDEGFVEVKQKIELDKGLIRSRGIDFLAYSIIDYCVDCYYPILEHYGNRMDQLEEMVVLKPPSDFINQLHDLKHELILLRNADWSTRDALSILYRDHSAWFQEQTRLYLRDCYDHSLQVLDVLESFRERATSLSDIYLSSINIRMNEIMKVLTMIATIFMPLGFLASVWGMNFDHAASPWNMPELHCYYGYPMALFVMLLISLALLYYFKRKGWFEKNTPGKFNS